MPSVADELAALRAQSLTKAHASKLKDANGLSTPEQEAEALKESKNRTSINTYKKDAVETLNKGTKVVDQDMQVRLQQSALKKQDMEKKKEAAQNLQAFKTGATGTKIEVAPPAAAAPAVTSAPAATPAPVPSATPIPAAAPEANNDADDIPNLDELPVTVDESSDDAPGISDVASFDPATSAAPMAPRVPNRAEKKARKMMERLGMKPVEGISRVTLKMHGNQGFFTIYRPDVFEKSGSYIVFGEARQGSGIGSPQARAAKPLMPPVANEKKVEVVEEVEEVVDETGVEAKDIELVVSQAGCSRAKAVKALKDNGGDLVNAIMSLTN